LLYETLAPKIIGMLIDFKGFKVTINAEILHERAQEAERLIQTIIK